MITQIFEARERNEVILLEVLASVSIGQQHYEQLVIQHQEIHYGPLIQFEREMVSRLLLNKNRMKRNKTVGKTWRYSAIFFSGDCDGIEMTRSKFLKF